MKKKKITKKPPTRVHAFRCTDEVWLQLEEVEALNSLVYARTDLIKITSVLSKKTDEEKLKLFKTEKFMTWWMKSVAELIQHWYSIEENISSPVLTKERSAI